MFVAGIILLHVGSVKPSQNPNIGWFFRAYASDSSFFSDANDARLVDKLLFLLSITYINSLQKITRQLAGD